mmetsp:Transcript_101390/g.295394  ORF Transcript_101390/g.295394 Transcript_101390/m.295394 type:complete len:216 (-) Transcript_101390:12-659(-)
MPTIYHRSLPEDVSCATDSPDKNSRLCQKPPHFLRLVSITVDGAPVEQETLICSKSNGSTVQPWLSKRQLRPIISCLEYPVSSSNPFDTIFKDRSWSRGSEIAIEYLKLATVLQMTSSICSLLTTHATSGSSQRLQPDTWWSMSNSLGMSVVSLDHSKLLCSSAEDRPSGDSIGCFFSKLVGLQPGSAPSFALASYMLAMDSRRKEPMAAAHPRQ